ncbi:MAG: IreB family regulatory phosphoprotein, partial [Halanaerobiales bacterium]
GDPAYITSYKDARTMIRTIDRDEIIEELLINYIQQ